MDANADINADAMGIAIGLLHSSALKGSCAKYEITTILKFGIIQLA